MFTAPRTFLSHSADDGDTPDDQALANMQEVFPGAHVISVEPTRETHNARYREGLCRDCGVKPHSAGQTRCDTCHRIWQMTVDGYDR